LTQDEDVANSSRIAAEQPPAPAPTNTTEAQPDELLEDDQGYGEDADVDAERYVTVRGSIMAVGLTLGAIVLLALLAGNVYQFLHYRGETTLATVNGAAITQSQFDRAAGSSDQALQSLIDQQLILQEAKKEKVSVSDAEVNAEVNTIKQQLGSPSEFAAALQRANLTEAQLRDQIRTQKLATTMGAKNVTVTDDEAQTYYNQNKPQFGTQTFDQAKPQISGQLLQSKQNEAIQTWIAALRQKAKISVHIPA
jgi:hypothetical protein